MDPQQVLSFQLRSTFHVPATPPRSSRDESSRLGRGAVACGDAGWHDRRRGGAHAGVSACPAVAGSGWPWSRAGCEGRGDRGAAPSADGAAAAGPPASIQALGPSGAGGAGPAAAAGAVAGLSGRSGHAAAVAPRVGGAAMDLPIHFSPPRCRPRRGRDRAAAGAGRIPGGVTCGSWASAASSGWRCPRARCAGSCAGTGWVRRRGVAARAGCSSCGRRRLGRWR
jgi:hypothetical protein